MMVVCSLATLVRATLFVVVLALVAGLALAAPSGPPGSGAATTATSEAVTH
ncbi:hypothetical protein [Amycolatopsis plumensis]|uniref:Uncharacterized protein n=1 Tax=Amycolatopsis plumensis TaxID=236508 RepID=A0ABV5UGT4_9PSEU